MSIDLCRESVEFYDCTATCVLVDKHVGKHHFKFDGETALREAREDVARLMQALRKLLAELSDVQLAAIQEGCGVTNRRVLELRINEAREALESLS